MNLTFALESGDEVIVDVPSRFLLCPRCEGHGCHLTPSISEHAYTEEEFREFDQEEREAYFKRGGMYDVTCLECGGKRVVEVPDFAASWPSAEGLSGEELKARRRAWQKEEAEYEALVAAERRMGA